MTWRAVRTTWLYVAALGSLMSLRRLGEDLLERSSAAIYLLDSAGHVVNSYRNCCPSVLASADECYLTVVLLALRAQPS